MSESLFNYEQARNGNQNNGEQPGYTVADHEREVHEAQMDQESQSGTSTTSPGLLNRFDQEQNNVWFEQQKQQQDEEMSVRRGQQRAYFARRELERDPGKWAYSSSWTTRNYPKCNEFVYEAHRSGDPLGSGFPTVLRESNPNNPFSQGYYKPTVDNLADKTFAPSSLEYYEDVNMARPGDIVVWYGNGDHHSAIATGGEKIIYAGGDGLKENTISEASKHFPGSTPIIRRYK